MKKQKDSRVKKAIYAKTYYSVKAYCEIHGLSFGSIRKGYISAKARAQLEKDGIVIEARA